MPVAWRLVKPRYAASAFSGEGAARAGGRWNSMGVPVVYTSEHRSLAALEMLVHLEPLTHLRFNFIPVEFPGSIVETLATSDLPADWRLEPPSRSTMQVGDRWVRESTAAVLAVPSVVVPGERNYLLNPRHRAFARCKIGEPEEFTFDPRLR